MSEAVEVSVADGSLILRMRGARGNAINGALLDGLAAGLERARSDPAVTGVLLASGRRLFSPGLDLVELEPLGRDGMRAFMRRFLALLESLWGFPKPVVAALSGHALAGGLILALATDWRVLRRGALVGFNEARVGVPLPLAVAEILRDTVPPQRLVEVALKARNYEADDAVTAGLVHELRGDTEFEAFCLGRLAGLAAREPTAYAATKRALRSSALARIRAAGAAAEEAFLDGWFAPGARARIREVVAGLTARRDGAGGREPGER